MVLDGLTDDGTMGVIAMLGLIVAQPFLSRLL